MVSILFLILLAAFSAIGFVEWLKAFVSSIQSGKVTNWIWPLVTLVISAIVALSASRIWPSIVRDSPAAIDLMTLWPMLFFVTIATIELGYQIVIKTFLSLLSGLGGKKPDSGSP